MATALQQQLAVINAKSTDQLNLKAQKARHSQSLLFEPQEAATQSFDTVFQICQEGFADLCQLDRRYAAFANNLFAESSVAVEREEMTASENKALDTVIEQFLGLVCGRLLLRPAQKSVEWLIRRWRIHEHNTNTILYAFLPYHGNNIFATLLSILPKQVPHEFSFLRPYIVSLQCPPRHALVSAAISNSSFISAFSTFVLSASKRRLQSSVLVGSWISILAQSLNARLDNAQSGRDAIQRQKSEDVLLGILPTMQEMLAIKDAPDLFLAACMIMTILATKIELEDRVLDALMDSVVTSWTRDTVKDGIECLAVLAEEKNTTTITRTVFNAVMKSDDAVPAIVAMENRLRADNLIAGLLERYLSTPQPESHVQSTDVITQLVQHALDSGLISDSFRQKLASLKQNQAHAAPSQLRLLLDQIVDGHTQIDPEDAEMQDADDLFLIEEDQTKENTIEVESSIQALPKLPDPHYNFLELNSDPDIFASYLACFESCHKREALRDAFLKVLHVDQTGQQLPLLTFLIRCWSTAGQYNAKQTALQVVTQLLSHEKSLEKLDFQVMYSYVLTALSDGSAHVRKAAAKLISHLIDQERSGLQWARPTSFGAASNPSLLRLDHADALLLQVIEPRLEDFALDEQVLRSTLTTYLTNSKVKSATKSAICTWIAAQAVLGVDSNMPITMLDLIKDVGKAATDARVSVLVPYLKQGAGRPPLLLQAAVQCLSHRTDTEIEALKDFASNNGSVAYSRLGEIFTRCKPEMQISIATWLFQRAAPIQDEVSPNTGALQTLRDVKLSVEVLIHLLPLTAIKTVPIHLLPLTATKTSEASRSNKRQRISKSLPEKSTLSPQELDATLKRSSLCLEIVEEALLERQQHVEDEHHAQLIKQLFNLLGELQTWRTATGSDLTYLQVLTLNNILATLNVSNAKGIDHSYLRTDMIVETLRSTASPQVHNSALLVISKIATFAPDTVLHSVMPLFTFMSSSTLRQVDAYSVHVINMTIESIVPPLRESLKSRGKELVAGASDLLLSFTAAFEHIPGHRRHDTFVQLLKVLGPDDALYAVLAMLVERYSEDNTLAETLRGIAASFAIRTQMQAFAQYLDLTADACKKRKALSETILCFSEKNAAEANMSVATLLDGWASLVSSPGLRTKINNELRKDNTQATLDAYSKLLERLVSLPRLDGNAAKFEEPTLKSAHDAALQALLGLLPTNEFITSSAGLMQAGSEQVRVKVFNSLTQRVKEAKTSDSRLVDIFVETLPNCSVFISTSQPVSVRKAALACVDAICEKFGKRDRKTVADVARILLSPAALLSDTAMLQTASLLCLASSVEILGEEFISIAGRVLKVALDLADASLSADTPDWQLVNAGFTLINAVLDHTAWLMDAAVLDRALILACQVREVSTTKSWSANQFCTLVPRHITLHELCEAIDRTFTTITQLGTYATIARTTMLQDAVTANRKVAITANADLLSSLVIQSFELRQYILDEDDLDSIRAYDISIQTALDMTLKMNDITFRPLYMRLVTWAETELPVSDATPEKAIRQIALYDFSHRLFDQLGSIVTAYASFILEYACAILSGSRSDSHWDELATAVLQTLQASFRQDQDDFWSAPQHCDTIVTPLLNLLVQPFAAELGLVTDTVVELAVNVAGSSEHLKAMNAQLMAAMRNQHASTRLAAVKCERQITERLTFDWLNLLPEMLPFISELLEDDDEAVEREVLAWVAQIEEVTGESLEGMLA